MNPERPVLILICGIISIALGCGLALVAAQVAGLTPLAVAMILLGSAILMVWLRSAQPAQSVPAPAPATEGEAQRDPPVLPGAWYPYALLGIGAALMIWLLIWAKVIR